MYIIYRNINTLYPACEVVGFYCVNIRLTVLVYGSRCIEDLKANFLKDGVELLEHFGGKVECLYL